MSWIQTYTGRKFDPLAPDPEQIVIEDIAHALSNQCRFAGHTKRFYSVAEHSIEVGMLCSAASKLWGLLHDASEAYLVDLPRPLKRCNDLSNYSKIEARVMEAVCERFGLSMPEPADVAESDNIMLATEASQLMIWPPPFEWEPLPLPMTFELECLIPAHAERRFLEQFTWWGGE